MTVLVAAASKHGATEEIATRIGADLVERGVPVEVKKLGEVDDIGRYDAFVVGSGVYMGSWLDEALDFVRRYESVLASRPLWLFSSGPLPGSSKDKAVADPIENSLGPLSGPGSGGRRRVEALSAATGPRDHHVFMGAYDPDAEAKNLPERFMKSFMRVIPAVRDVLPAGDFRDWDAIERWALRIADELASTVPAGR